MQIDFYSKKIVVFHKAVDFRASIDRLSILMTEEALNHVQDGIYIFFNRAQNKIKILTWHINGYVLLYKRLEWGRFHWKFTEEKGIELSEEEFKWLLLGLEWKVLKQWKELSPYEAFG